MCYYMLLYTVFLTSGHSDDQG